jgi:exonuclease SbcC
MIGRLRIKNFQKHKSIDVKFDPHVTTIVGPSDSGKSALIRALRWVVFNKPNGTEFIRSGEEKCSVRVEIEGHKITRIRGKENTYQLDGETYRAFGNDVPGDIQDALSLGDLNFQEQHDSPFWLSESAGQVSRNLNQIVNLGIMDSSLSQAAQILKKAKWTSETTKDRFKWAKGQKNALKWAVEASDGLDVLETQETALEAQQAALTRLSVLVGTVERYDSKETTHLQEFRNETTLILKSSQAQIDHDYELKRLKSFVDEIEGSERTLKKRTKVQEQIQQQLAEIEVCPLCQNPMT